MYLTDSDKKILDGQNGPAAQKALELIVRYGEVIGAPKLCSVTWADLFCGTHAYLDVAGSQEFDTVFSKMALCTSETIQLKSMAAHCICYSGVEPDCTEVPGQMFMGQDKQTQNLKFLSRFADANVILSGNCIPYLTGFVPLMGDHFVSCESSAVLFMNSVWGAMGNGDGIEASFCSAVCGRTPKAGMHQKPNRAATIEVKVTTDPESLHDWDMLGYTLGRKLPPHAIPVITGKYAKPNSIILKTFFASLACAAGTEMCHMVGITPEAPDIKTAFQGRSDYETITVSGREMNTAKDALTSKGEKKLDYITIGCPHLHVDEIRDMARFLDGKKVHSNTRLDIWTTGSMRYLAQRSGYAAIIENAGANLLTGGCPSNRGYPDQAQSVAMDASKQRQDVPAGMDIKNVFFGSRKDCLKSAVKGFWTGAQTQ